MTCWLLWFCFMALTFPRLPVYTVKLQCDGYFFFFINSIDSRTFVFLIAIYYLQHYAYVSPLSIFVIFKNIVQRCKKTKSKCQSHQIFNEKLTEKRQYKSMHRFTLTLLPHTSRAINRQQVYKYTLWNAFRHRAKMEVISWINNTFFEWMVF